VKIIFRDLDFQFLDSVILVWARQRVDLLVGGFKVKTYTRLRSDVLLMFKLMIIFLGSTASTPLMRKFILKESDSNQVIHEFDVEREKP